MSATNSAEVSSFQSVFFLSIHVFYKLMASCSGFLLCLMISRDLIKEPIVTNSEMVSSLEFIYVLRASGSLLQYVLHNKVVLAFVTYG